MLPSFQMILMSTLLCTTIFSVRDRQRISSKWVMGSFDSLMVLEKSANRCVMFFLVCSSVWSSRSLGEGSSDGSCSFSLSISSSSSLVSAIFSRTVRRRVWKLLFWMSWLRAERKAFWMSRICRMGDSHLCSLRYFSLQTYTTLRYGLSGDQMFVVYQAPQRLHTSFRE